MEQLVLKFVDFIYLISIKKYINYMKYTNKYD